jgi:uncharacterized membrane protein YfcA
VDVIERSASVLLGMAAGYVLWLAGMAALTVVVPTQYIIVAAGVLLVLITISALVLADRFKKSRRHSVALAFWLVPALPATASIYSFIVFLN